MYKRITIILAIVGLTFAVWVVATAERPIHSPEPAYPPSVNPFGRGIVALGVVETATRDIGIAPPEPGRVQQVHAAVGQGVKVGDPLFTLDTLNLEAEMVRAVAARDSAAIDLKRQESWPRAEDIPPLRAAVAAAKARLDDAVDRMRSLDDAMERNAANPDEVSRQRFLVTVLRGSLNQSQAELDKYLAGPWSQDVAVSRATLAEKEADVRSLQMRIDRMTVRSPVTGSVLKRDVEPGEYLQPGGVTPAMVVGDLSELHVRAQVDEEDMQLLKVNAPAKARVRGPRKEELDLTMLRIEPLARPKRQITNSPTELVDTRVVDVLFSVKPREGVMLVPGSVVDVYIDAPEVTAPDTANSGKPG